MSCERYAPAIVDHACGAEIAPDARQHLDTCAACRTLFDRQRRAIQALDNELQQALAIEPSPYFERKVLARIERTTPARPRVLWWMALATAAAAVIVFGLNALRSSERNVEAPPTPMVAAPADRVPSPVIQKDAPVPPPRREPPPERVPQRVASSLPRLEVIVDATQAAAVERYMALLRNGRLDTSNLAKETQPAGEPPELVVAPLEVQPLTVSDVEIRNSPMVDRQGPQ